MHISQDERTLNRNCNGSLTATWKSKYKLLVNDGPIQLDKYSNELIKIKEKYEEAKSFTHFSSITSYVHSNDNQSCEDNIAAESITFDHDNFTALNKYENKEMKYRKDVQLFYVFERPFNRNKQVQEEQNNENINQENVKCTALTQVNRLKDENKALKRLVDLFTESVECKCVAKKLKQLIPHMIEVNPDCTCAEAETQVDNKEKRKHKLNSVCACEEAETQDDVCKCVAKQLKQLIVQIKELQPECTCVEAKTQAHRFGGRIQRAGRELFYTERGTTGVCKCCIPGTKERISFKERSPQPKSSGFELNLVPTAPKCIKSCARCLADKKKEDEESFKSIFRKLIESNECKCLANSLKQIIPHKPPCTCVEANTQSRSYGGDYQRAGRESFYRETGTSGTPAIKNYQTLYGNPTEEDSFGNSEDLFDESYRPATVNRRVGGNGRYNAKCCYNAPQDARKFAQSSTYCKLDNINKDRGVFTTICNVMLQPTNIFPGSKKCCNSRGTHCNVDDNGGVLKKFYELLIEPKNMTNSVCCKSRGALCNVDDIRDENNSIKRFYQMLLDPKGSKDKAKRVTGAEAMTQSRSYGGRYQRAGREIYCRNRGTCGAPKLKQPKAEYEGYEEVVEECLCCIEDEPTNRGVGIGTNCKFNLGWFKDRDAYGEPNCQCDLKDAIEQWNDVPLRQIGTKIGASINRDTGANSYNTHMATQSRRCRGRDLRAGRETFYKNAQTSCKNKLDEPYNVLNPTGQCPALAPDRKAIRWGSDCSFSFEISKDVPPESPDKSRPCRNKTDANQNKDPFYSRFIRQWLSSEDNEQHSGELAKSDAFTSTHVCEEDCPCECENLKKSSKRRPLHIGSKVSYNFNFTKRISPPKATSVVDEEPFTKSGRQERVGIICDPAITSECVHVPEFPEMNKYDIQNTSRVVDLPEREIPEIEPDFEEEKLDVKYFVDLIKSAKKSFLEVMSKKNFLRLIKGADKQQTEIQKILAGQHSAKEKDELISAHILKKEQNELPKYECPAKCNTRFMPAEQTDQPLRMETSFSFDYNMRHNKPKHDENAYEEIFLTPEDFSGSVTKLNLFRLIIGKLRKRVKTNRPHAETPIQKALYSYLACDPNKCPNRKQPHNSWFSYILDNIKQERQLSTTCETDTKNFFTRIMLKQRKKSIGEPYILTNLKKQLKETISGPVKQSATKTLLKELLLGKDSRRRRRRRRRRGSSKSRSEAPTSDEIDIYSIDLDTLASSIPSRSRTAEDCKPCRISSDCCFKCYYNKLDDSNSDTRSTQSTIDSRNYATT